MRSKYAKGFRKNNSPEGHSSDSKIIQEQKEQIIRLTDDLELIQMALDDILSSTPVRIYFECRRFIVKYILPKSSLSKKIILKLQKEFKKVSFFRWRFLNNKSILCGDYFSELSRQKTNKKRILVIPSWYPTLKNPLAGTFFREQSLLMDEDFDVLVLHGMKDQEINLPFELLEENNLIDTPKVITFKYKYREGFSEFRNYQNMIYAYNAILKKILNAGWQPDLIHAHSTVYGGIVANEIFKKFKIPYIVTEHQTFLLHNFSRFLQQRIFASLEMAKKVAAVSTDKMRAILMHGIQCNPVVVGNYVEENLFTINNNIKSEKFEILIVAAASFIKDLKTFFDTLKELENRDVNDFHATLIGMGTWGESANEYLDYAKKIDVYKHCTFISTVAREKMPYYYQKSNVFVSTSIAEGFQVSILEAMACGKPVISTAHGGAEDILNDKNGVLVKIRDSQAIADNILKIKEGELKFDSNIIRSMVVERYGSQSFRKAIGGLYGRTINNLKILKCQK